MSSVPKLRFKEFSGDWESKKLGNLLEFKNGINASKEQYGHGKKFINVLDILNNNYITHENIVGKVDVDEATFEKYSVGYGDIVFQRSSETREEVGTANVYLDKDNKATFGGFIIRGMKVGEYDPIFMNKLLKTSSARKEITTKSGGSTRYNVGQETLSEVSLLFPKLEEQEKIASFFSLIDDKISLQREKVEMLKSYKTGMMQKIFSRELRFKNDDGRDYPEWEEKKLGDICTFFSGGTPLTSKSSYYNGDIPFIRSAEISGEKTELTISEDGLNNSSAKMVQKGDLLYALYGATSGEVSISKIGGAINQAILCIKSDNVDLSFIEKVLRINKETIINTYLQGGQGNLSANIIKGLKYLIPHLNEQKKISNFLDYLDTRIEKEQEKLDSLNEYKKGLLQQMFV